GVDLVARIPGSATISRPLDLPASAAGLIAGGSKPARISGFRIAAADPMPGTTAISVTGAGAMLELLDISGPYAQAITLEPSASLTMHGSRVAVNGTVLSVPEGAQASFVNNIF